MWKSLFSVNKILYKKMVQQCAWQTPLHGRWDSRSRFNVLVSWESNFQCVVIPTCQGVLHNCFKKIEDLTKWFSRICYSRFQMILKDLLFNISKWSCRSRCRTIRGGRGLNDKWSFLSGISRQNIYIYIYAIQAM